MVEHKIFVFFIFISIAMAGATALQFYTFFDLKDTCTANLRIAPLISGSSLALSFFFNSIWIYSKNTTRKVAIVLWTIAVIIGTVSAGATLGQIQLYPELDCEVKSSLDYEWVQVISIVLLIISISLPHGMSKKRNSKVVPKDERKIKRLRFL
tara:strand:- start:10466 stop:10924 length:459 start_codon:yes stop_codon:yes gene_type:complete